MVQKYAVPLTLLFTQDGDAWVALACEVYTASQGDTLDDAREMVKEAVEIYVTSMVEIGKADQLADPVDVDYLAEYFSGDVVTEYHTLIMEAETDPEPKVISLEFLPSAVEPLRRDQSRAA